MSVAFPQGRFHARACPHPVLEGKTTRPKRRGGVLAFCLLAVLLMANVSRALTNNLALTPPMGWNDWNTYGCSISETIVTNNAIVIATNGMKAAGYQFVNIDDCWQISRDANSVIVPDAAKFPHGIAWLAAQVHSTGLKLGVYSDHGTNTCQKKPGSYLYEYVDALTYAQWGADYLKDDNCNVPSGTTALADYGRTSDGLMRSGRPMVFCICGANGNNTKGFESWSPVLGNYWRTTGDIGDNYASMISHIDPNSTSAYAAGPGRWNDPDMLEVGRGGLTATEDQTHFTMWCIMAAPLIMGNNLTSMSATSLATLTNPEAIAVDQDPMGEQGIKVVNNASATAGTNEVWSKTLGYDFSTKAVVLFNRLGAATNITCNWTNLGLLPGAATVRDLWAHADLGGFTNSFTTNVPSHGVVMLKITGTPAPLPVAGTNYLSDLTAIYAYTGFGTITKDKDIVGATFTLNGVTYSKGIGVNSRSGVEYNLGGIASRFQATIGVDDDVGSNGSVDFQVFADGSLIYDSGIMTGGATAKKINLDVTGVRRLTLGVGDADNGNSFDHGDWVGALVTVTNTTPQPPSAPSGLSASSGNGIALTWNNTLAALTYNVKRAATSGGPYVTLTNVPVTTFTDTNVVMGSNYYYVVSAVSSLGEGSNSFAISATPCNAPSVPTNLVTTVATIGTNSFVTLTWEALPGASSYAVSRFTGTTPPGADTSVVTTNYTDANVVPGATYYYQVAAANSCSASLPSLYAAAVIPALVPTAPLVWNGGSESGNTWLDAANWNGTSIAAGAQLIFDGDLRLNNTNDTAAGTTYPSISFNPGSSGFVLNGNAIFLTGGITNNSPAMQVINLGLSFSNNLAFNGANGPLLLAGGLTNTLGAAGFTTLTLAGTGMLNNLLNSANSPGGTNIIAMNDPSGNWTLENNASATLMSVPWVFSINSGTFNFGSSASAPLLTMTTPNNSPSDNQAGTVTGTTGTLNMLGGVLTTAARLNTATALNSTGIVNQTGGTFNLGSQFQGANGGNAGEVSLVNLSGGTMNVAGGSGPFYVASRGSGTLTMSNAAALNCGTLDVSRNASGNSMGSVGVVNLNGGVLLCSKVGTATANGQTNWQNGSAATFNFNSGTLKINSSTALFFQGSTVAPYIPISAVVKAGGAVIDSNGRTNVFAEPLLHDTSLGSTPDGGLTKNGTGCLLLVSNLSYTGNTTVNAGMLALSNGVMLDSSAVLNIAAGAVLDASGRNDGTLTLVSGQTLTGSGTVNGNSIITSGATLAPGNSLGTLTFANNLTLSNGSVTVIEINKSAPATNDQVLVAGKLTYGGTLVITNLGANALADRDAFKVFNAPTYAGGFISLIPATPGANLAWNTNGLVNGMIGVVRMPPVPPQFGAVNFNGNHFILSGSNGVPYWPYLVLTSTNLALPVANWARVATNVFDAQGGFVFTNSLNAAGPQNFYLLQLN